MLTPLSSSPSTRLLEGAFRRMSQNDIDTISAWVHAQNQDQRERFHEPANIVCGKFDGHLMQRLMTTQNTEDGRQWLRNRLPQLNQH